MSASSRVAKEVDEAMSASSWTALANVKERDWWSIDLEGEVEKLEVSGPWSGTTVDSVEPKGEMGHKSDRAKVTRGKGKVEGRCDGGGCGRTTRRECANKKLIKKDGDSSRISL